MFISVPSTFEYDRALPLTIDGQLRHIRAGVMTGWVKILAFFTNAFVVQCSDDQFFFVSNRLNDPFPVRASKAGTAGGEYLIAIIKDS